MDKHPMRVDSFAAGDRVEILAGAVLRVVSTGTVVRKSPIRNNGYLVRWDEPKFGVLESWVRPLNMRKKVA